MLTFQFKRKIFAKVCDTGKESWQDLIFEIDILSEIDWIKIDI